jgi:hypothetical protein
MIGSRVLFVVTLLMQTVEGFPLNTLPGAVLRRCTPCLIVCQQRAWIDGVRGQQKSIEYFFAERHPYKETNSKLT